MQRPVSLRAVCFRVNLGIVSPGPVIPPVMPPDAEFVRPPPLRAVCLVVYPRVVRILSMHPAFREAVPLLVSRAAFLGMLERVATLRFASGLPPALRRAVCLGRVVDLVDMLPLLAMADDELAVGLYSTRRCSERSTITARSLDWERVLC
ncbi:hypothetical protein BDW74DRAFT_84287 [Aspergillus multicolor]|uniref:uncharacterized protein n=1 Tax=Aspergillus multicolor TaxID=41759 RepID=UPI003CCCF6D2